MKSSVRYVSAQFVILASALWSAPVGATNRGPDFDNDDKDDIALGVFRENISGVSSAGAVHILYGGAATGLHDKAGRTTTFYRSVSGVEGDLGHLHNFGVALAWGDFNDDCYDDLVVADDQEQLQVFYGSSTGLSVANDEIFGYALGGYFRALAAGDFNGDGYDDIAAGNPDWDDAGAILILHGSEDGLTETGMQVLNHFELGIDSFNGNYADFGRALTTGDFDCNGVDDLAIGAQHEHSSALVDDSAGAVYVVYGQEEDGLGFAAVQTFRQGVGSVKETAEPYDEFGWSLASGNFNGDTSSSTGKACHDLAIGAWGEDLSETDAGLVHVLYGVSGTGLQAAFPDDQIWHRDLPNILGTPNETDIFGYSVLAGKFNSDAYEDLAIGVPNDDSVTIILGSSAGLVDTGDQMWTQDTLNVPGTSGVPEQFGFCLAYGVLWHPDALSGLAVCNPAKHVGTESNAGMLHALYINNMFVESISTGIIQSDIGSLVEAQDSFPERTAAPRDKPFACD